jgi:hypothetical protein
MNEIKEERTWLTGFAVQMSESDDIEVATLRNAVN